MNEIKITVLKCGTMHVSPKDAYIKDRAIGQKRIELPVNVFYIEHPVHGRILVDTGWSSDVKDVLPRHLLNFYKPEITPGQTAKEQLHKMGIEPEDIDIVLLTHLDVDHTCALKDFAGKAKRIVCAEHEYFYSARTVYKLRQVWDTWMPYVDMIERIHFRASVLGPVGRGFDLFGDDSILCIFCPGHTSGLISIILSKGPSNRFKCHGEGHYGGDFVVIASDVAFTQRNIDDIVIPGYGFDHEQHRNGLQFIHDIQADPKCLKILCSHDPKIENYTITY